MARAACGSRSRVRPTGPRSPRSPTRSARTEMRMADSTDIRETVRERYAAAATASAGAGEGCCGGAAGCGPADETGVFGASLYDEAGREGVPDGAVDASLGCGVPTAVADLHEGETVLDLGSGAGADV